MPQRREALNPVFSEGRRDRRGTLDRGISPIVVRFEQFLLQKVSTFHKLTFPRKAHIILPVKNKNSILENDSKLDNDV